MLYSRPTDSQTSTRPREIRRRREDESIELAGERLGPLNSPCQFAPKRTTDREERRPPRRLGTQRDDGEVCFRQVPASPQTVWREILSNV